MDTEVLSELGLTNAEIKIYLALLELGKSTAGPIIKKTDLQNSVVHLTLPKLIDKGLASFVVKGGVKEYSATSPEHIFKFIDEKKSRFQKLLPELVAKQKEKSKEGAEVFQGIKGLKVMLYDLIKDTKKGDEFLFFAFDTKNPADYENIYSFYRDEYHKERLKKDLVIKGLAPMRLKDTMNKTKWVIQNVKFTNFPIPTNISIVNEKIIFTPLEGDNLSFLLYSKQLSDSFRQYFYSIWDQIK